MPLRCPFAEASDVMDAFQSFVTFREATRRSVPSSGSD